MVIGTAGVIVPTPAHIAAANVADRETYAANFSWAAARARLDGLPGGGLNIAHEAVDRHARGELADHVAFRFLNSMVCHWPGP